VILKKWGLKSWLLISQEMHQLVNQKGGVLHNAGFGHIGHKRPEIADGYGWREPRKTPLRSISNCSFKS